MAGQTLTKAQMKAIIERGESVGYQGRVIDNVDDLPSDTELAQGNPDQTQALLAAALKRRQEDDRLIEALQATAAAQGQPVQTEEGEGETVSGPTGVLTVGPEADSGQFEGDAQMGQNAAAEQEADTGESSEAAQPARKGKKSPLAPTPAVQAVGIQQGGEDEDTGAGGEPDGLPDV